jgi:hypothetical protein
MIAAIRSQTTYTTEPEWHTRFIAMMPVIQRQARISFRGAGAELREELIQAVLAAAFAAYARLVRHGKEDVAFPSSLARFAVKQVRAGRRVGGHLNVRDVASPVAQNRNGFIVERLDSFDVQEGCWREILLEDKRATPAEIAACRLDFSAWLARLPRPRRMIALALASGETTTAAAERFRVTPARISQLRTWFRMNWLSFQGDVEADALPHVAVA